MNNLLGLDEATIARARSLAAEAAQPVIDLARGHTTVAIERAALRICAAAAPSESRHTVMDEADPPPWPNVLVDAVVRDCGLGEGATLPVFTALAEGKADSLPALAKEVSSGRLRLRMPVGAERERALSLAREHAEAGTEAIATARRQRSELVGRLGNPVHRPWLYIIVATGDIREDVVQAKSAARSGADIIAVIRSTGQSLLDFVPEGASYEGFAGTYATQENFRIMRAALDEVSEELGRYVRLCNYASGLCMPEMAALAGVERLDVMLNDSMYGILFRDINPLRTFVDQRFSRQIHAWAGIMINTGEDNYLTTDDAVTAAHTVTVSQLLNECFAHEAGLPDELLGLGHAFEIDPEHPKSFRLELAHAMLARTLFPEAPLKYMPPTKHMTGDIFRGQLLNGFFNLAGLLSEQSILLVGMMTEAVVTPMIADRTIALDNARYVRSATAGLTDDVRYAPTGFVAQRARKVLDESVSALERIVDCGLLTAIADGTFGLRKRPTEAGRGAEGVFVKDGGYVNPVSDIVGAVSLAKNL